MTTAPPHVPPVTLQNCDREPIHVPGAIQPHGALLAFVAGDAGLRVCDASLNVRDWLGASAPQLGDTLGPAHFQGAPEVHALLAAAARGTPEDDGQMHTAEVRLDGRVFDLVVHRMGPAVLAEFESRPAGEDGIASFALRAHRAMNQLRRQPQVDSLLALAVRALRELTGFDRVMAYRFRSDSSGEVVAEDRHAELEPFTGLRYPAGDIPAQARRLYLLNTLRLIADVDAVPVPLHSARGPGDDDEDGEPLDMSHGVLRSVSPIHIEYLRNMGVAASMSISIVIGDKLWGLLACHHRTPRRVPYSVRMACDVLAQVLAANVQSVLAREHAGWTEAGADLRARVVETVLHADDTVAALGDLAPALSQVFGADALLVAEDDRLLVHGGLAREQVNALLKWVNERHAAAGDLVEVSDLPRQAPDLEAALGGWCGVLSLRYDEVTGGRVVLLRREQVETIHWAGKPEKTCVAGPHGPRLTPRGSFDVWQEEVRGTCEPWSDGQRELARQLLAELVRANAAQINEIHRARTELLAMLGHDLRDPLQSISMAAKVLERGSAGGPRADVGARLGQRIQSSSSRMSRLIGQMLDVSRLQIGMGLQLQCAEVDLVALLEDLLDEVRTGHPQLTLVTEMPASLRAWADADRITQLFGNLVSNARHHGAPGEPVIVQLSQHADRVHFEVSNHAPPIAPELVPQLFSAFKRHRQINERNRNGLGLGLHIAQAIAAGHGGSLEYAYAEPYVVFSACFPVRKAEAGGGTASGNPSTA